MRRVGAHQSKLRQWSFKAIVADSRLYRKLTNAANDLVLTSESLLDVVVALEKPGKENPDLALLGAELHGCFKSLTGRLDRMSNNLDHHLRLLSLSRDMSQSKNVQVLTIPATIFLPFSLSAGVLSMQTRFKDLGHILYDFFGVVVLLGTAVAILLVVILVLSVVREFESVLHQYGWYRSFGRRLLLITLAGGGLTFGALVLSSFVVGMFKDVVLGAKILGYGTVAGTGIVGLPIAGVIVIWLAKLGLKLIAKCINQRADDSSNERKKENDPESNGGQQVTQKGEKAEPVVREEPSD
ncbi:Ankyrin repeat protein [Madurella fahalii]|uniref:Ankyrin repeat protein n=1 Tax=Madurella fahalii TaxID=1157608 RepID=A0ABQ0GCQ9_9PEZI